MYRRQRFANTASIRHRIHGVAPQSIPRSSRQGSTCHVFNFSVSDSVTKLYVGNLPFSATEDQVRALFATHGTVDKVSLVNDRETGRPRGFGFVEMPNADATRAMQALDGKDFGGRPLKVNEAQERERAPRGNFGGGGGGGGGGRGRF
jgi:RNA recognition motif-containing protein